MKLSLVLIIYRSNSTNARDAALICEDILINKKIRSIKIESNYTQDSIEKKITYNSLIPDMAIVLGGDGTVLKSANALVSFNIPILSFNIGGQLGFLTQDKKFLFNKTFISHILSDEYVIDSRKMLQCTLVKKDITNKNKSLDISYLALNDFYFKSIEDDVSPTNQIRIEIDNEIVNEYKGDGLIIASPTGSTAYSMAAGGPIIHPLIEAVTINPICPMSLSSRPIVVPDTSKIIIKTISNEYHKRSLQLWKDGTKCLPIIDSDYCEITKSKQQLKIVSLKNNISYYSKLTKKLDWKGNLSSI